jgi:hypothetical protein
MGRIIGHRFFVTMSGAAVWLVGISVATSQIEEPAGGTPSGVQPATDEFGNVIPRPLSQRPIGLVLEDPVQLNTPGAQLLRRRLFPSVERAKTSPLDTLAVGSPLERQSTLSGTREPGRSAEILYPFPPWAVRPGGTMRAWLMQRQAAVAMRSPGAAVTRATGVSGTMRVGAWGAGRTTTPPAGPDAPLLEGELAAANRSLHAQAVSAAWSRFREGQYRRASRMFQTAVLFNPGDLDSAVGEVFSEYNAGAFSTAQVVLAAMVKRFENPFASSLVVADRLGSAAFASELRTRTRLAVQVENLAPEVLALHALVLWYLGERAEAMIAARRLDAAGSEVFSGWAERMAAASGG